MTEWENDEGRPVKRENMSSSTKTALVVLGVFLSVAMIIAMTSSRPSEAWLGLWGVVGAIFGILAIPLFIWAVQKGWNYVVPPMTGWKPLTFKQTAVLVFLIFILGQVAAPARQYLVTQPTYGGY